MYKNLAVQTLGDAVNGSYPPLSPPSRICCNGVDSKQPTCVTKKLRDEMDGPQRMTQVGFENRSVTIIHMKNGPTNGVQNGPKSFNISDRNHEIARQASVSPTADGMLTDDGGPSAARFSPNRLAGSFTSTSYSEPFTSDSGSVAGMISRDELLNVMTEDLVDWFMQMYPSLTQDLEVDTFYDRLSDGILLCHHAAVLHQLLMDQGSITYEGERAVLMGLRIGGVQAVLPKHKPSYQTRVQRGSVATSGFVARDNVANFLIWCRQLGMPDSVLFESEDAVCRKNPRNVAVCLLELARLGGSLGMSVPGLILLEKEIDEELEKSCVITDSAFRTEGLNTHSPEERKVVIVRENSTDPALFITVDKAVDPPDIPSNESAVENGVSSTVYRSTRSTDLRRKKSLSGSSERYCLDKKKEAMKQKPEIKRPAVDMRSLDEIVRELLSQCTCKQTFPVNRIGEGRYLFGDKCTQIFVRILRNHVMVRVGGGWDTLSHFLSKYDECRKTNNFNNRVTKSVDSTLGNGTSSIDSSNTDELLESLDPNPTRRSTETHVSPIRAQGRLTAIKKSPAPEHKLPNDVSIQNTDKKFPVLRNDTQLHGLNKTCNSSEVGGQLNKRTSMVSGKYQAVEQRIPQKCLPESRNKHMPLLILHQALNERQMCRRMFQGSKTKHRVAKLFLNSSSGNNITHSPA
ncbi:unnamed protein product [Dicrocoelium dendriticum]|nr:unnamed protein product [Dicrocoelium dendriticum]